MKEKFLPIGTVCTLRGINKSIMISGFFGVSYNGTVKMYDYIGYEYPEGMLLQNKSYLFNHYEIEKVEFMGYESEAHQIMNNNLLKENVSTESVEQNGVFSNFKFDENGVVIFDGNVDLTIPQSEPEIKPISNPFNEIYNKPTEQKTDNNIFSKFKFDENGVVIAEEQDVSDNTSNFKFDENGVVIAENNQNTLGNYVFDENGFVVADNSAANSNVNQNMNDMIVIADDSLNIQFEEKPNKGFVFDENGFVVQDNA